jgi:hypothetical protein
MIAVIRHAGDAVAFLFDLCNALAGYFHLSLEHPVIQPSTAHGRSAGLDWAVRQVPQLPRSYFCPQT